MNEEEIKKVVRNGYAEVAKIDSIQCAPSCCGTKDVSQRIGYSEKDIKEVPEDSNLGLGCGNPVALASLKEGEVVLDLCA
jgi:hypothetical protein